MNKTATTLEQSRKLAEFLPIESADMCWTNHCYGSIRSSMTISAISTYEYKKLLERFADSTSIDVFYPCWSLAALLELIPDTLLSRNDDNLWSCKSVGNPIIHSGWFSNPIDACYEIIIKLKEKNLL